MFDVFMYEKGRTREEWGKGLSLSLDIV